MNLTFSDSVKFAQAALNFLKGNGSVVSHSFFSSHLLESFKPGFLFQVNFPPLPSWLLSLIFRFFPATDTTIAFTGISFLFLSVILVLFIGKKLHSTKAGVISSVLFLSSIFFQEYALNFSSEILFIFLILLSTYLFLLPKKLKILSIFPLTLMFLTRQQTTVFLGSFLITCFLAFLLDKTEKKKKALVLLGTFTVFISILLISYLTKGSSLSPASIIGSFNIGAGSNFGTYIRGGGYPTLSLSALASKIFYNFYNFIKAPERLAFVPIFFLFIYSLFIKSKKKELGYFKLFTSISLFSFLLAASATLPNARYVHPIIPLVMIYSGIGLVELVKQISPKLQNLALATFTLFIIFPTIGHFTLDARARTNLFNTNQPPVYRVISSVMADNIDRGHLIITNLDAWAAWYEGLTTMWFPLEIDMLEGYEDKIDYIVITNYKEDDGDFALRDWGQVVYTPLEMESKFLNDNFEVLKIFEISADQVYENQWYKGTILINKRLIHSSN